MFWWYCWQAYLQQVLPSRSRSSQHSIIPTQSFLLTSYPRYRSLWFSYRSCWQGFRSRCWSKRWWWGYQGFGFWSFRYTLRHRFRLFTFWWCTRLLLSLKGAAHSHFSFCGICFHLPYTLSIYCSHSSPHSVSLPWFCSFWWLFIFLAFSLRNRSWAYQGPWWHNLHWLFKMWRSRKYSWSQISQCTGLRIQLIFYFRVNSPYTPPSLLLPPWSRSCFRQNRRNRHCGGGEICIGHSKQAFQWSSCPWGDPWWQRWRN